MSALRRLGERRDARRSAILAAARRCFLRFGYPKTSLSDIAHEARLTRTLLYLCFKSKEEILAALFESTYETHYEAVAKLVKGHASRLDKLLGTYEQLIVAPWSGADEFEGSRMLFRAWHDVAPALASAHRRRSARFAEAILQSKELAEVFEFAVEGLRNDSPSPAVFRRRFQILAGRFAA